jgi:hypothetical protein
VDALFAAMARDRQENEAQRDVPAVQDEQPLPTAVREIQPVPLAPVPVRTLVGRIYAALTLVVVGPPAFFGLRRAARKPRVPAKVRLTKSV